MSLKQKDLSRPIITARPHGYCVIAYGLGCGMCLGMAVQVFVMQRNAVLAGMVLLCVLACFYKLSSLYTLLLYTDKLVLKRPWGNVSRTIPLQQITGWIEVGWREGNLGNLTFVVFYGIDSVSFSRRAYREYTNLNRRLRKGKEENNRESLLWDIRNSVKKSLVYFFTLWLVVFVIPLLPAKEPYQIATTIAFIGIAAMWMYHIQQALKYWFIVMGWRK